MIADQTAPTPAVADSCRLFISGEGGYHTYRIPALAVTTAGTLLAFCEGRRHSSSDTGDIDLLLRRSTDGGATWSAPLVVWDDGANTCGNPCVVVDPATGVIWLLSTWNLGCDREHEIIAQTSRGTRRVFVTSSADDGLTWTPPHELTAAVKQPDWTWYATGPGAGICLQQGPHRGRLVIPCDHIEAGSKGYFSHVIYSDDHGQSWQLGGRAPHDGVNECEVVELADGRLLLNMRNYQAREWCRQVAISDDGGATWRDQRHDPALPEPRCQASLRRHTWPTGNRPGVLLFTNPGTPLYRANLTLRASFDDGATWPLAQVVHAGPAAYSCLAVQPTGEILCLYEGGERAYTEAVRLARIPAAWAAAAPPRPGHRPARAAMNPRLKQLLTHLADTIDVACERQISTRHSRALSHQSVDRPPVVMRYPLPADSPWQPYPHREIFDDPEKMLFNELVSAWNTSIVHRQQVGDDLPATVRPNFGTVLVASVFGARIEQRGDDPPWATSFPSREACAAALARGPVTLHDGWLPCVVERYRIYRELLADFPPLPQLIALTLPDLQGPLDTLEMLRGSALFVELAEEPELTAQWLAAVAAAQVAIVHALRPLVSDGPPGFVHQHGFLVAGQLLLRNDSALMLSPAMYRAQIAPHDESVLRAVGGGGVHSCGRFMHQIPGMLELPSLRCLDFGEAHLNDRETVVALARPRQVGLVRLRPTAEELASGAIRQRFPTGASLLYHASSLAEAQALIAAYHRACAQATGR